MLANLAPLDNQEHQALKVLRDLLVLMVLQGKKDQMVAQELLVPMERQDQKALKVTKELQDLKVLQAIQVLKVNQVNKAHKVNKDHKDQLALKVLQAHKEIPVLLVPLVPKVLQEVQGCLVHVEKRVLQVLLVNLDNLVLKVLKVLLALKVLLGNLVLLVHKAVLELQVNKVLKAHLARKVLQDQWVLRVVQGVQEVLVQLVLQALYFNAQWYLATRPLKVKLHQLNAQVELPQLEAVFIVTLVIRFASLNLSLVLTALLLLVGKENVIMEKVKLMLYVALLQWVIPMARVLNQPDPSLVLTMEAQIVIIMATVKLILIVVETDTVKHIK